MVTVGSSTKEVRIIHSLFSVNTGPDSDAPSTVARIYGVNKVAPFKTTASGAIQARLPSSIQFSIVTITEQFREMVGDEDGKEIDELAKLLSSHLVHPQVFLDLEGKREWEASDLGFKLISP